MSYAQRHRHRAELHQSSLDNALSSTDASWQVQTPLRKATPTHGDPPRESGPQRRNSSLLRANAVRIQQGHSTGIDIAAWSEAASNAAAAGERQPFQLLQHTPPKNEPPRLKASRKQFASPQVSAAPSEASQSIPASLPIIVNTDSPDATSKHHDGGKDPLATDLRTGVNPPASDAAAAPAPGATTMDVSAPSQMQANQPQPSQEQQQQQDSNALATGEMSPSPIPVSHQPSQPQVLAQPAPQLAESSTPSSARASASQWPTSETFTTRLRNIIETRQQIEALVQKQREDEAEMVHAIAALDEQSQVHQSQHLPSSPDSVASFHTVSRRAYEQVLMERNAAFAALREFKEKGNAIVHRLYDTVKLQQEQSLELVATVEALKKANKRLKEAVSNGGGGASASLTVSEPMAELQQKVATQRRVIEQMDQLMQNADSMLLAMRARVEAAERRAASSAAPLDRRQLPPLPKSGSGGARPIAVEGGPAALATPDAVAAIERLADRYPADPDVATVAAQQQLLLERIAQLRQSLKQEEAQRLHLEEVYGATSEETARNVALLEERLQRAENPRGVPFNGNVSTASNASALRRELHKLLEEGGQEKNEEAEKEMQLPSEAAPVAGVTPKENQQQQQQQQQQGPLTPSHASSRASSESSTPTRTLFTAVSVGDAGSTTAANEFTDEPMEKKKAEPSNGSPVATAEPVGAPARADDDDEKDTSPLPRAQRAQESQQQPRAFLRRHRSKGSEGGSGAVAKAPLGIPVPEASSLGNSLRRSFNSRSSSASRRLVEFRHVDVTSRGPDSMSDVEEEEETVDVEGTHNNNSSSSASGITGVTSTVTPTAIHSASSPLPDTSTSVKLSAKRQQRLHMQKEELDKMEADVTDVVRSLDTE